MPRSYEISKIIKRYYKRNKNVIINIDNFPDIVLVFSLTNKKQEKEIFHFKISQLLVCIYILLNYKIFESVFLHFLEHRKNYIVIEDNIQIYSLKKLYKDVFNSKITINNKGLLTFTKISYRPILSYRYVNDRINRNEQTYRNEVD